MRFCAYFIIAHVYLVGCFAVAFYRTFVSAVASVFIGVWIVGCLCSRRPTYSLVLFFCAMVVLDLNALSLFISVCNYISGNGQKSEDVAHLICAVIDHLVWCSLQVSLWTIGFIISALLCRFLVFTI